MADGKAASAAKMEANGAVRRARDTALTVALDSAGLLPDLIRLIRSYDLRVYRWKPVGRSEALSISPDGRSVTVARASVGAAPKTVDHYDVRQ
jgi:hypothetical protein